MRVWKISNTKLLPFTYTGHLRGADRIEQRKRTCGYSVVVHEVKHLSHIVFSKLCVWGSYTAMVDRFQSEVCQRSNMIAIRAARL